MRLRGDSISHEYVNNYVQLRSLNPHFFHNSLSFAVYFLLSGQCYYLWEELNLAIAPPRGITWNVLYKQFHIPCTNSTGKLF